MLLLMSIIMTCVNSRVNSRLKYVKGKGYKEIDGVKITMAWEDGTDGIFLDLEGLYDVGYEENESLRAAPYDWRYAAGEVQVW